MRDLNQELRILYPKDQKLPQSFKTFPTEHHSPPMLINPYRFAGETCPPTSFTSEFDHNGTGDYTTFDALVVRKGQRVSTGFAALGVECTKFSFSMRKQDSPTGTCFGRIRNAADTIVAEFGSIDVSTLSTSFADVEFTNSESSSCAHTLIDGDRICIEYVSAPDPDDVHMDRKGSNPIANTNACSYDGSWSDGTEDSTLQIFSSP